VSSPFVVRGLEFGAWSSGFGHFSRPPGKFPAFPVGGSLVLKRRVAFACH